MLALEILVYTRSIYNKLVLRESTGATLLKRNWKRCSGRFWPCAKRLLRLSISDERKSEHRRTGKLGRPPAPNSSLCNYLLRKQSLVFTCFHVTLAYFQRNDEAGSPLAPVKRLYSMLEFNSDSKGKHCSLIRHFAWLLTSYANVSIKRIVKIIGQPLGQHCTQH